MEILSTYLALCVGNPADWWTGFPLQRASNAELWGLLVVSLNSLSNKQSSINCAKIRKINRAKLYLILRVVKIHHAKFEAFHPCILRGQNFTIIHFQNDLPEKCLDFQFQHQGIFCNTRSNWSVSQLRSKFGLTEPQFVQRFMNDDQSCWLQHCTTSLCIHNKTSQSIINSND